jgi:hypothetical protein
MAVSFSQALEAARNQYAAEAWARLTPAEQVAAIYKHMRRLEREHSKKDQTDEEPSFQPIKRKPPGRRFEPPPII